MAIALTDLGTKVPDSFQFFEILLISLEFSSFATFILGVCEYTLFGAPF